MTLDIRLSDLITRVGTEFKTVKASVSSVDGHVGTLSNLTTTAKSSLVDALNELVGAVGGAGAQIDDGSLSTLTTWSSDKSDSEITARISAAVNSLVGAAPGTLDTLGEIATALGDDANVAATLTALITTKADDSAVVKLTGAQTVAGVKTFSSAPAVPDSSFTIAKVAGLTASLATKQDSAAIGNPDSDLVTLFETAIA